MTMYALLVVLLALSVHALDDDSVDYFNIERPVPRVQHPKNIAVRNSEHFFEAEQLNEAVVPQSSSQLKIVGIVCGTIFACAVVFTMYNAFLFYLASKNASNGVMVSTPPYIDISGAFSKLFGCCRGAPASPIRRVLHSSCSTPV